MKIKILILSFILLFIYNPSYGLNLTAENFVGEVIKSIKTEPENWIVGQNYVYYINKKDQEETLESLYPQNQSTCFVAIYYDIFNYYNNEPYIKFEKPIELAVDEGSDRDELAFQIAKLLHKQLEKSFNIKSKKKSEKIKEEVERPKKPITTDGMSKL